MQSPCDPRAIYTQPPCNLTAISPSDVRCLRPIRRAGTRHGGSLPHPLLLLLAAGILAAGILAAGALAAILREILCRALRGIPRGILREVVPTAMPPAERRIQDEVGLIPQDVTDHLLILSVVDGARGVDNHLARMRQALTRNEEDNHLADMKKVLGLRLWLWL